jgi:NAD(P)-dependent dehydrogenase (short-subunit alcohol dehydrogenase family)
MVNVLIIGGTRGLGAALANSYAKTEDNIVFGTTRSARFPTDPDFNEHICWVPNIDLLEAGIGVRLVNQLGQFGVGSKNVKTPVTGFDIVVRIRVRVGPVPIADTIYAMHCQQ